jgi:hypothetical protein
MRRFLNSGPTGKIRARILKLHCTSLVSVTRHQAGFLWKRYGKCAWRRVAEMQTNAAGTGFRAVRRGPWPHDAWPCGNPCKSRKFGTRQLVILVISLSLFRIFVLIASWPSKIHGWPACNHRAVIFNHVNCDFGVNLHGLLVVNSFLTLMRGRIS